MPDEPVAGGGQAADSARRAADALAAAKADARARGEHAPSHDFAAERKDRGDPPAQARRPRAARPGRARREDPQPLQAAIDGLLDEQGWRTAAAVGSVFGRWDQIVGPDLAAHTWPGGFTDGELLVVADSTAWATQVRLLAATLVRRLNTELGPGTVIRVKVRGPAPPRQSGQWRVRDGRGPRDDYG
ncbi:MAG TPA: DciA family protein [Streptosporangiaceae bacterium]|nr:DciA family protein [Streptosporangiaceae bacterium]